MAAWPDKSRRHVRNARGPDAEALDVSGARRWVCGFALALAPLAVGAYCLAAGRACFITRAGFVTVTGIPAVATAVACIGLGLLLHFHFFWSGRSRGWRIVQIGRPLALFVFVVGLVTAIAALLMGITERL